MSTDRSHFDPLRRAFVSLAEGHVPSPDCPDHESLFSAATGGAPASETRRLVDHSARCPSCAEVWRIAHELTAGAESPAALRRSPARLRYAWLAAAAVVAAAVSVPLWWPHSAVAPPATFRAPGALELRSAVPEDVVLPRDGCVLRWTVDGGPTALEFDILVATDELAVLARGRRLTEPVFRVDPEKLAAVPPGGRILWRVEAIGADNRRTSSPTFVHRLE